MQSASLDFKVDRRVAYFHCDDFESVKIDPQVTPFNPKRYAMTHELLKSLNLLKWTQRLRPRFLKQHDLSKFHDDQYLRMLDQLSLSSPQQLLSEGRLAQASRRCGFLGQSTVHNGAYQFSRGRASGSVGCAEIINSEEITLAVNFEGGMYRAKPDQAIGGHFINDVVLCLLTLCEHHSRVLYINVGYEHNDGVEEAFYTSNNVMCLSFHGNQESGNDQVERQANVATNSEAEEKEKQESVAAAGAAGAAGAAASNASTATVVNEHGKRPAEAVAPATGSTVAPLEADNKKLKRETATANNSNVFSYASINGTGKQDDIGHGRGLKCTRNVPLPNGLTDADLNTAFGSIYAKAIQFYRPNVIVMNVNASSVAGDRGASHWNLSSQGFAPCIGAVRASNLPFILLGSGGEHASNAARTFAACAAAALGMPTLTGKVPENDAFFEEYQRYGEGNVGVTASNMENEVNAEALQSMVAGVVEAMSGPALESEGEEEEEEDEEKEEYEE